jgi:hypothetical protein
MHFKLEAVNQHGDSNAYKMYVHNYKNNNQETPKKLETSQASQCLHQFKK